MKAKKENKIEKKDKLEKLKRDIKECKKNKGRGESEKIDEERHILQREERRVEQTTEEIKERKRLNAVTTVLQKELIGNKTKIDE